MDGKVGISYNTVISNTNFDLFEINNYFKQYAIREDLLGKVKLHFIVAKNYNDSDKDGSSAHHILKSDQLGEFGAIFKNYLDTRIVIYQFEGEGEISPSEIEARTQKHSAVGDQLWNVVVLAVRDTQYPQKLVAAQILPQLSDMFTASDNQRLSMKFHPPMIIFQSLILLCMIGALISGYNLGIQKQRDWFLTLVFIVLMTGTIFIILSLEFPRIGKISLNNFEIELISLRKSFQ
jgi:hypothetical protein